MGDLLNAHKFFEERNKLSVEQRDIRRVISFLDELILGDYRISEDIKMEASVLREKMHKAMKEV